MDEIIKSLSAKFNLPESTVRSGIGVLLKFLREKAAGTEFEKFLAMVPGATETLSEAPTGEAPGAGGLFGGLLSQASGLLGGNLGGIAEVAGDLQKAGVPLDKAAPLAGEFLQKAQEHTGPEVIEALLSQIPALKSLLGETK